MRACFHPDRRGEAQPHGYLDAERHVTTHPAALAGVWPTCPTCSTWGPNSHLDMMGGSHLDMMCGGSSHFVGMHKVGLGGARRCQTFRSRPSSGISASLPTSLLAPSDGCSTPLQDEPPPYRVLRWRRSRHHQGSNVPSRLHRHPFEHLHTIRSRSGRCAPGRT